MSSEEEWKRLEAMIAEAKRHKEIAEAQRIFEPVYRDIEIQRSRRKNSLKLRQITPSVEDVAIARGIIRVLKPEPKPRDREKRGEKLVGQ